MQIIPFLTVENQIGRFDYGSLTDQTRMELLIEGFGEKARKNFQDADNFFIDVCKWETVECDRDDNVVRVSFRSNCNKKPIPSMSLELIPPMIQSFILRSVNAGGTLETADLSQTLEIFKVTDNKFHGTVDFAHLPQHLIEFSVHHNTFSGSADLESLPEPLKRLWLYSNSFSGTLCLTKLPPNLENLDVSLNAFYDDFCLQNAPNPLRRLRISGNRFNEVAIVPSDKFVQLKKSGVLSVLDAEGNKHPDADRMMKGG